MSDLIDEIAIRKEMFRSCAISKFIGWYVIYDDEIYLDEKKLNR